MQRGALPPNPPAGRAAALPDPPNMALRAERIKTLFATAEIQEKQKVFGPLFFATGEAPVATTEISDWLSALRFPQVGHHGGPCPPRLRRRASAPCLTAITAHPCIVSQVGFEFLINYIFWACFSNRRILALLLIIYSSTNDFSRASASSHWLDTSSRYLRTSFIGLVSR